MAKKSKALRSGSKVAEDAGSLPIVDASEETKSANTSTVAGSKKKCPHLKAIKVNKLKKQLQSLPEHCISCPDTSSTVAIDENGDDGDNDGNTARVTSDTSNKSTVVCLSCMKVVCSSMIARAQRGQLPSSVISASTVSKEDGKTDHAVKHFLATSSVHNLFFDPNAEPGCDAWCFGCNSFIIPEGHNNVVINDVRAALSKSRQIQQQQQQQQQLKSSAIDEIIDSKKAKGNKKKWKSSKTGEDDSEADNDNNNNNEEDEDDAVGSKSKHKRGKKDAKAHKSAAKESTNAIGGDYTVSNGVFGLVNLGNTCFFNSTMQALIHTKPLQQVILTHPAPPFAQLLDSASGNGGESTDFTPLLAGFARLLNTAIRSSPSIDTSSFQSVTSESKWAQPITKLISGAHKASKRAASIGALNPGELFGPIAKRWSQFKGFNQQDAHELLRVLVDGLDTDAAKMMSKSNNDGDNDDDNNDDNANDDNEKNHLKKSENGSKKKPQSFIAQLLGGRLASMVLCDGCHTVSHATETFFDLSLPLAWNIADDEASSKIDSDINGDKQPVYKQQKSKTDSTPKSVSVSKLKKTTHTTATSTDSTTETAANIIEKVNSDVSSENEITSNDHSDEGIETPDLKGGINDNAVSGNEIANSDHEDGEMDNDKVDAEAESAEESNEEVDSIAKDVAQVNIVDESLVLPTLSASASSSSEVSSTESEPTEPVELVEPVPLIAPRLSWDEVPADRREAISQLFNNSEQKSQHEIKAEHSISHSLMRMTRVERLLGDNRYACQNCAKLFPDFVAHKPEPQPPVKSTKSHQQSSAPATPPTPVIYRNARRRQLLLDPLPPVLVLHLKRFAHVYSASYSGRKSRGGGGGVGLRKIDTAIEIPEFIDMKEWLAQSEMLQKAYGQDDAASETNNSGDSGTRYRLYAVVDHDGSMSAGHYTAIVRVNTAESGSGDEGKSPWVYISDTRASPSTLEQALAGDGYIYFYEKC